MSSSHPAGSNQGWRSHQLTQGEESAGQHIRVCGLVVPPSHGEPFLLTVLICTHWQYNQRLRNFRKSCVLGPHQWQWDTSMRFLKNYLEWSNNLAVERRLNYRIVLFLFLLFFFFLMEGNELEIRKGRELSNNESTSFKLLDWSGQWLQEEESVTLLNYSLGGGCAHGQYMHACTSRILVKPNKSFLTDLLCILILLPVLDCPLHPVLFILWL